MSESTPNPTPDSEPTSSAGPNKETPDFTTELRELGQQFEAVFRAAIESERAKQLQRDLSNGVRELTSQVHETLKNLQDDPRVARAEERGRELLQQAQESKVVQELQETLVTGIAQLNVQLRKLADRLESQSSAANLPPTSSQQIPIEHERPSTDETTRLDDETTRLD